ncbi:dihydroflavonol-4-reductase [Actinoplanes lutulentus]|uniref:Dihydroflavonol-4-reductase n=1 Tax=Actinoplanes lutulentus TaxID=1287878 RepID=A0A327ZK37_9ACTN|nr:aldehyde reductase [Actinoplanes lutulentus]MBB2940913.1 dihydroflavonol-4-reductase [Actinoplanes lutulentus]RAK43222.1 dihydroflavonol-4-reductase [Actinoplanes lutulentus]
MLVLVTGGSGFVGAHCIRQLLAQGHRVRTTVRTPSKEQAVRATVEPDADVSFAVVDLNSDVGWATAAEGCDAVLHVASPFPGSAPKNPDDLIVPAREGTLRALRAARDAGVRRTVLTSSFAAIGYGHRDYDRVFTEADWSDPDGPELITYSRSKLVAERAAWDFVDQEGGGMELTVINPVGILGPVLGPDLSVYVEVIEQLLNGKLPLLPRLNWGVVDVRDVADLHVRAMVEPAAAGERFVATAGTTSLPRIAGLLRERLGPAAARVPSRTLPDWGVRLSARLSPRFATVVPDLGVVREASSAKARDVLGWKPRPIEETVLDTATSLAALGLLTSA